MDCIHGTDTGRQWGNCACHAIECRCADRLAMLRQRGLRDAVDYHTQLARRSDADPYSLGYVLVREKWCCAEKCSYFTVDSSPGT